MGKITIIAVAFVAVVIIGGGVLLASWDIPAPSSKIEKPYPDEKLPK